MAVQCCNRGRPFGRSHKICRTHYRHRPGRDVVPRPVAGACASGCSLAVDQVNSVPSTHMRCMTTASLRATATLALRRPLRLTSFMPQAFSADHFGTRNVATPCCNKPCEPNSRCLAARVAAQGGDGIERLRRCPSAVRPSSLRSSAVRVARTVSSSVEVDHRHKRFLAWSPCVAAHPAQRPPLAKK